MRRILCAIFLFIIPALAFPFRNYALEQSAEEIRLYLGEDKVIPVSNPTRIAIGNPNVVDVVNVSTSEMTLTSKAPGKSTLVFWDDFGEQSFTVQVFSEDINEIKRRVDNMLSKLNLPDISTQAEEEEDKVVLLGRVKTNADKERIALALGSLKEKTVDLTEVREEEAVVEIDVQVLELNRDATDTLGFTWPGAVNILETASSPGLQTAGADFGKLFTIKTLERATTSDSTVTTDPFAFKLDLLVQEGKARVLSRPRVACQSGKEAELLVGGEKPVFTTTVAATTGAAGTEVEYKEYGIKLKVKPTVSEANRIKLALNVEVSEVGTADLIGTYTSSGVVTSSTAKAYPLSKRSASTELFLDNGQTMAIGGLIKEKTEEDVRKVPWLGDIPVLGAVFRKKTTTQGGGTGERGNTELFITLTPRIISGNTQMEKKEIPPAKAIVPLSANVPEPVAAYAGLIQKRILDNLTYPLSAKQAGFQGTTKLSLHLSFRGELLGVKIKSSSGYNVLDENAVAVAKGIASYPPFPSTIAEKELWIDIPIVYQLD